MFLDVSLSKKNLLTHNFIVAETELSTVDFIIKFIEAHNCKIIGISGASGGGKTVLTNQLVARLGKKKAIKINVDGYLRYSRVDMKKRKLTGFDIESRDMYKFLKDLEKLKKGKTVKRQLWDENTQSLGDEIEIIHSKDIIILEDTIEFSGIADLTIFVFAPDDILVKRRMERDNKMDYWKKNNLEKYIRNVSLPAYRKKHMPVAYGYDLVIDTFSNLIYQKKIDRFKIKNNIYK